MVATILETGAITVLFQPARKYQEQEQSQVSEQSMCLHKAKKRVNGSGGGDAVEAVLGDSRYEIAVRPK